MRAARDASADSSAWRSLACFLARHGQGRRRARRRLRRRAFSFLLLHFRFPLLRGFALLGRLGLQFCFLLIRLRNGLRFVLLGFLLCLLRFSFALLRLLRGSSFGALRLVFSCFFALLRFQQREQFAVFHVFGRFFLFFGRRFFAFFARARPAARFSRRALARAFAASGQRERDRSGEQQQQGGAQSPSSAHRRPARRGVNPPLVRHIGSKLPAAYASLKP